MLGTMPDDKEDIEQPMDELAREYGRTPRGYPRREEIATNYSTLLAHGWVTELTDEHRTFSIYSIGAPITGQLMAQISRWYPAVSIDYRRRDHSLVELTRYYIKSRSSMLLFLSASNASSSSS